MTLGRGPQPLCGRFLSEADEQRLQGTAWPRVVAVAGRLAQVRVSNDLGELVALHNTGPEQTANATQTGERASAVPAPDEHQKTG